MGRPGSSDGGAIVVGLVVVAAVLMVALGYLLQCAVVIHSAALASTQAGREAARAFSQAGSVGQARRRALAAARLAFSERGFALPPGAILVSCLDGGCLSPGSAVLVEVDWAVPLPGIPWESAAIRLTSTHRLPVDDFRSALPA